MDSTTTINPRPRRDAVRTLDKPTAEEKQQAREVSLRRIARLFAPHRWPIARRRRHHRGVVGRRHGLAVPAARRHRHRAARSRTCGLLVWLVAGMVAVAAATAALGVVQTWISTKVGQQVMHALRTDVFAHLQRQSLDFFTRTRTGEVQSRITNDIGGMQSVVTSTATSIASNLTTAVATAVAMAALSWRLVPDLAGRDAAGDPADPPGRPHAQGDHRAAPARARRPQRHHRRGPVDQRRPAGKTMGTGPALVRRFTESVRPADRPRAALRARRSLADGLDERHLRRDPGRHLPQRRPADDRRHHDDRHPDRLHRACRASCSGR